MGDLDGSKRLPVPSFIEPVVNITKENDSHEEDVGENKPEPEMNNREQVSMWGASRIGIRP